MIGAITAATCHDLEHDGFTNTYHVNFMTNRAVRYHDKAIQENWHASLCIKLLLQEQNDFVETISPEEKKLLRMRMVEMILATDMADHASHLNVMKNNI